MPEMLFKLLFKKVSKNFETSVSYGFVKKYLILDKLDILHIFFLSMDVLFIKFLKKNNALLLSNLKNILFYSNYNIFSIIFLFKISYTLILKFCTPNVFLQKNLASFFFIGNTYSKI